MSSRKRRIFWKLLFVSAVLACLVTGRTATAQVRIEAFVGEPFGVARLEVQLPPELLPPQLGKQGVELFEAGGRVLYPTVVGTSGGKIISGVIEQTLEQRPGRLGRFMREREQRPLGRLLGEILGPMTDDSTTTVYFLFQGTEPLEMTLLADQPYPVIVTPQLNPSGTRRLLAQWWKSYASQPGLLTPKDDHPKLVETYLQSMLAGRLGLRVPEPRGDSGASWQDEFVEQLGVSLATEPIRLKMQQQRFLNPMALFEPADQPLPDAVPVTSQIEPTIAEDVEIEALAMHAPADCLYIRFGSFANFLWVQDTLKKWGGDLQNLMSLRGLDYAMSSRIESQLVMKQSAMARLFGGAVIADVAIIAADTHFQDGGAFGLLFQARNSFVLATDIKRQRTERIDAGDGVTEETVTIAGRDVSLLTGPDGSVRSFYVADAEFHLITRSEAIVRSFLAAADGDSLGATDEFAHARSLMPLDRGDKVFAYLPSALMQTLVSPHGRIETVRRMQAMADIELVELARLAAMAESYPADTIEGLIAGRFLPDGFGMRPDGSQTVLDGDVVYDSLRGHKGHFLPVADVAVDSITASELSDYRRFEQYYQSNWGHMDPIMAGIRSEPLDSDVERVWIDARMSPFSTSNFNRLREKVGEADNLQLARVAEDIGAFEAILTNQRLFAGLQDVRLPSSGPTEGIAGVLLSGVFHDFLIGYLGTVGDIGVLKLWNLTVPRGSDAAGYAASPLGLWRRYYGEFTLFSFHRPVLEAACPQLAFVQAERDAQIRVYLEDISQAQITPTLNNLGYARTQKTSRGNLRLMHDLGQQFHVAGPERREVAERLIGAGMICPLGGEYECRLIQGDFTRWASTGLDGTFDGGMFSTQAPAGFVSPPLNWFRGLEADALVSPGGVVLHAQIDMKTPSKE